MVLYGGRQLFTSRYTGNSEDTEGLRDNRLNDLLFKLRGSHLLKFLEPSKIVARAMDQPCNRKQKAFRKRFKKEIGATRDTDEKRKPCLVRDSRQ